MKQTLEIIFAILISPFVILGVYDVVVYMPKMAEIKQIIELADSEDKKTPETIRSLIEVSHQQYFSSATPVVRGLVRKYMANPDGFVRFWGIQSLAWDILTHLHFSKSEIISLYCTLAYNGQGYGLNALSVLKFNKPLSALTTSQAAEIVAYLRAPGLYDHNHEALEHMRDILLERLSKKTQLIS